MIQFILKIARNISFKLYLVISHYRGVEITNTPSIYKQHFNNIDKIKRIILLVFSYVVWISFNAMLWLYVA